MAKFGSFPDITVDVEDYVATVEINRPPNNFFDKELINAIADAFEALDETPDCRSIVLCAEGKHFCAGNDFSQPDSDVSTGGTTHLYKDAVRIFHAEKPVICAVQGAAVGGGLGVAMVGDFRVAAPEARFVANFTLLGFHPGFGLTHTLPRVIGLQNASRMFYTGWRVTGDQALKIGLADELVPLDQVRGRAVSLAREIAAAAPLATRATRATLRAGLADAVAKTTDHELAEQNRLCATEDFKEGIKAVGEHRPGNFQER